MNNDERLREALLELDALRRSEAEKSRESEAVLAAIEAMTTTSDASAGIAALLSSIEGTLGCDLVALFTCEVDGLHLRYPDRADMQKVRWVAPGLDQKKRRIVDLRAALGLWASPPAALSTYRSMLSVPLESGARKLVIIGFSRTRDAFSARDADLLQRLATIAAQAIIQRSLEEQSAFLSAVIDASPVSVAIADARADMPLVYVNAAFTQLTGFTADEVIGSNCRIMSAEPPKSIVRRALRETLAAHGEGQFTLRNKRKSGEEFWNDLRVFPINDTNGQAMQIVAMQTDATVRINAEIERDNARRRLEGALSATSDGFLVIGASGTMRFANATFQALFGDEYFKIGRTFNADSLAALLADPNLKGAPSPLAYLQVQENTETEALNGRQVLLRARPIEGGGVVVAITDLTQSKLYERTLRQRLAAIEMSQDGIAIGDPDGHVLHANPSLVALWGLPAETDSLGREWISFYTQKAQDKFAAQMTQYNADGVWRDHIYIETQTGEKLHDVSLSRVPQVGTVLIVRDITEQQQELEERNRLRLLLDQASMQDHFGQMSAGLAHDFNNLLSTILASASLIDTLDNLQRPAEEATQRIKAAATKAASLVDGFLDLGLRKRETEKLNLGEAILTTVDLARAGASPKAKISISLEADPVWVKTSQTDLLQVLMNLVGNSLDALEEEFGTVHVSLQKPQLLAPSSGFAVGTFEPKQVYAAIRVQDTGKGMDADTAAKMLDPYFTTKGNSGTGLGLAIVKAKLSANRCLMTCATEVGSGTVFTVYWPVHDLDTREGLSDRKTVSSRDRLGLPLLVIDDEPEIAADMARELHLAGFEVAETSDPQSALETLLEDPDSWGCVVTDFEMPQITGADLLRRVARDAPGLPVIIVSALAKRLTDPHFTAAHAVLSKPVDTERLITEVRSALRGRE